MLEANYGMASPHGYRTAMRLMQVCHLSVCHWMSVVCQLYVSWPCVVCVSLDVRCLCVIGYVSVISMNVSCCRCTSAWSRKCIFLLKCLRDEMTLFYIWILTLVCLLFYLHWYLSFRVDHHFIPDLPAHVPLPYPSLTPISSPFICLPSSILHYTTSLPRSCDTFPYWLFIFKLHRFQMAERFGLPVITLVDTVGAWPTFECERDGQSEVFPPTITYTLPLPTHPHIHTHTYTYTPT